MQLMAESKPKAPRKGKKPAARGESPAFAPLVCSDPVPSVSAGPIMIEFETAGVIARLPIDTPGPKLREVLRALRGEP
jgi:hypothetical protein